MKIRLLVTTLICALVALPAVRAQEKKEKEDTTPMGEKMEKASGAWRAAKRQLADATKTEDTLAKLATVKESLTGALEFEPALTKEKPEADRAKFVADFRDRLKAEIGLVDKVIAAVKAGNTEDAQKLVAEADKAQKEGHTDFRKQKKKKA